MIALVWKASCFETPLQRDHFTNNLKSGLWTNGYLRSGFSRTNRNWQYWHKRLCYVKIKKSATKYYLQWALSWGLLPFQFDAYPTEQVLVSGSLNCLLFLYHLILELTHWRSYFVADFLFSHSKHSDWCQYRQFCLVCEKPEWNFFPANMHHLKPVH